MQFNKIPVENEVGGKFLKLKSGEFVSGRLKGEIYNFHSKWVNGKSQLTDALDPEGRPRFRVNFVIFEEGKFKAKIWEFTATVYNQLADIQNAYPNIQNISLRITRSGVGMDTLYSIIPLNESLTPAMLSEMAKVDLNILEHKDA